MVFRWTTLRLFILNVMAKLRWSTNAWWLWSFNPIENSLQSFALTTNWIRSSLVPLRSLIVVVLWLIRLELPPTSLIHPVFHVSQLKVLVGNVHTTTELPTVVLSDVLIKQPEKILERKMVKRQGRAATKAWWNGWIKERRKLLGSSYMICNFSSQLRTLWSRFSQQERFSIGKRWWHVAKE